MYVYTYVYIYIYGFLVCRYARSLGLAARQNTPAINATFYYPIGTSYQLQPSFHTQSTEPESTARARRAGEEFYYGGTVNIANKKNNFFRPLVSIPLICLDQ